ncbi:MAG: hypothetical protein HN333_14785 [Rhodospirillaceae bacterium]|nr:hypothetical protein [Rhodospirillaceae bacterium]
MIASLKRHKRRFSGSRFNQRLSGVAAIGITVVALAACNTSLMNQQSDGGIEFREDRHAELTAMREYRDCRDEALALDAKARRAGSPARYLASARMLEGCEAALGPQTARLAVEERMRAYALSIQNHFKGGDVAAARENLGKFKAAFVGKDLYYADGSSFTDSMTLVLGEADDSALGEFSVVNVSPELKAELRRVRYWQTN